MATNRENFGEWYVDILGTLYPHRAAGFAIVMIALPLLERYLRNKTKLAPKADLNDSFYNELVTLFPEIGNAATAKQFWQIYRNGLLHEVTLSLQDRKGYAMPVGSLSHDIPEIERDSVGNFSVHPVDFAKRIVQIIQDDFSTFDDLTSTGQFPSVKQTALGIESSTVAIALSTNCQWGESGDIHG